MWHIKSMCCEEPDATMMSEWPIYICCAMTRWPPFPVNYVSWFPCELQGKAVSLTESPYSSRLLEWGNWTLPSSCVARSRGSSLEVSQLVYTSDLSQSASLWLILHCSSQERRFPLRSSSRFKQWAWVSVIYSLLSLSWIAEPMRRHLLLVGGIFQSNLKQFKAATH